MQYEDTACHGKVKKTVKILLHKHSKLHVKGNVAVIKTQSKSGT